MGLLSGGATLRKFQVSGEVPDGFRTLYRNQLEAFAFKEDPHQGKEPTLGWVEIDNMLGTNFTDVNKWFYEPWIVLGLRIDVKTAPSKIIKAYLQQAMEEWKEEHGTRCPPSVKSEMKDRIEENWLKGSKAKTKVIEMVWDIDRGLLLLGTLSDGALEHVEKRFNRTFGLKLSPWPLALNLTPTVVDEFLACLPSV